MPKKIAISLLVFVLSVIVLFVAWFVYFFVIPPSFQAEASRQSDGTILIYIDPNHNVRSIYEIIIADHDGELIRQEEAVFGPQRIILHKPIPKNSHLAITCDLQYDRPVPSLTTVTKSVEVP